MTDIMGYLPMHIDQLCINIYRAIALADARLTASRGSYIESVMAANVKTLTDVMNKRIILLNPNILSNLPADDPARVEIVRRRIRPAIKFCAMLWARRN